MEVTQIFGQRVWCDDIYLCWKAERTPGPEVLLVAWSGDSRQVLDILQRSNVQFFKIR